MADHRDNAGALSRALSAEAEAVCRHYLPAGRRSGHYWTVGDVSNSPGGSLYVRLTGPTSGKAAAGRWCDAATGQHGDLLDLIALNRGHGRLRDAMDEARGFLALPTPPTSSCRAADRARRPDTMESARRLFGTGCPIRSTPAERYLAARGIHLTDSAAAVLRFHPAALYREAPDDPRRTFPTLLAPVTDLAGMLTGVHRTYLDPGPGPTSDPERLGKAPVASPRRSLGRLAGHGVSLRPGDWSTWLVGEGLETILSLAPLFPDVGIMAALSAAHLAMLTLPTELTALIIARDNDMAGRGAAERLRERAERTSIVVTVLRPRLIDFNADLRRWGPDSLHRRVLAQLPREGQLMPPSSKGHQGHRRGVGVGRSTVV